MIRLSPILEAAGFAGVVAGVGAIYWPAAAIIGGAMLLLLAAVLERQGGRP